MGVTTSLSTSGLRPAPSRLQFRRTRCSNDISLLIKEAAMPAVRPIPEGYHSLTPQLTCRAAAKAIEFYEKVFGAKDLMRMPDPNGRIAHAELQIGDSRLMVNDEMPG